MKSIFALMDFWDSVRRISLYSSRPSVRNSESSLATMPAARTFPSSNSASSPNESPVYNVATRLFAFVCGSRIRTSTLPLRMT
jgi:hypothetical protein